MEATSDPIDDQEGDALVARAAGGDTAALEALLRAHGTRVCDALAVDARWSRDFDQDDLLQITSIEAILRIRTLRIRTLHGFQAWFRKLAENNLRDAIRGLQARKRTPEGHRVTRGVNGSSARTLLQALASHDPSASAILDGQEAVEQLKAAIGRLPGTYRAVVEQLDLKERDFDDVAEDLGRTKGALHMLRSRAHQRLRELLLPAP